MVLALVVVQGSPLVRIVQFARKLDMYSGVGIYFPFRQKAVYQFAQSEHRAHSHRVAYAVQTRRAQAVFAQLVGHDPCVGFGHRGMIQFLQRVIRRIILLLQIVFDADLQRS